MRRRLTILGSTGSVGRQALDVVRAHRDRFDVVGLSASSSADLLRDQATEFGAAKVALESPDAATDGFPCEVLSGPGAAEALAGESVDIVLNGIVGFAGLAATVAALGSCGRLALANKESLVAGGEWVMGLAGDGQILSVDSEHASIYQCLEGRDGAELDGILLTASGGPFYEWDKGRIAEAGPQDALKHPTWSMGAKISIDSATMMNKGLEVIEAHRLFGVAYDDVKVVVHRQSIIHGGVFLRDGSVVLHAAVPDMRLPIAFGLLHPERVSVGAKPVPLSDATWTFGEPRNDVFRCLPLAVEAGKMGGAYPVVLNAANEVAVQAFLDGRISFPRIADAIEEVLEAVPDLGKMRSMEAITAADGWARAETGRKTGGTA